MIKNSEDISFIYKIKNNKAYIKTGKLNFYKKEESKMKKLKSIAKSILMFRMEYIITPLYITLFILSIIYVGFTCTRDTLFNIFVFMSIPACFIAIRLTRRMLYKVYFGKRIK